MRSPKSLALVSSATLALTLTLAHFQTGVGFAQSPPAKPSAGKPAAPKPVTTSKGGAAELAAPLAPDVAARIQSGEPMQIQSALDDVRLAGDLRVAGKSGAQAANAILVALERGLPPKLAIAAMDTLAEVGNTSGADTLVVYTSHRSKEVRVSAARALANVKAPSATKALRRALADSEASVRSAAATSIGASKAKEAMPELILALDHRVNDAAVAIGQVCTDQNCEVLTGRLGRLPFDVVTSGLAEALLRPAAEVSDETKQKLIAKVSAMATTEAKVFLRDTAKKLPPTSSQKLRAALDEGGKGA